MAKGLLFDFDGTLYGDWRLWISTIEETLDDFQIKITPYQALERARDMINKGNFVNISGVAIALAKENGLDRDSEVRTHFLEKMDAHMDETGPGNELVKLLKKHKQNGFRMGIVTFMRRPRLVHRLDVWKLSNYFRSIMTPDLTRDFKPAPQPFLRAMKELGVAPRDCLVIGDEPVDMTGGKRAGAQAVGLQQGFFSEDELRQAGADYVLPSLSLLQTITK